MTAIFECVDSLLHRRGRGPATIHIDGEKYKDEHHDSREVRIFKQQLVDGAENVIQVHWLLLPLKHLQRSFLPFFQQFTYYNDEKSRFEKKPQDSAEQQTATRPHMFVQHYLAYRNSLLSTSVLFSLLIIILEFLHVFHFCHWTKHTVDEECNPLPAALRGQFLEATFYDLHRVLYYTTLVKPCTQVICFFLLLTAFVLNQHKQQNYFYRTRHLIWASWMVAFCIPLILELVPLQGLVDWKHVIQNQAFELCDPALCQLRYSTACTRCSDPFSSDPAVQAQNLVSGCSTSPTCMTLKDVCKVAQGAQGLIVGLSHLDGVERQQLADGICIDHVRQQCSGLQYTGDGKRVNALTGKEV